MKEQRVPHRRMGKYVRFTHDDCDEILRHWAVAVPPRRVLKRLLDMKTRSGYGATTASAAEQKRAGRAARALVEAAEAI